MHLRVVQLTITIFIYCPDCHLLLLISLPFSKALSSKASGELFNRSVRSSEGVISGCGKSFDKCWINGLILQRNKADWIVIPFTWRTYPLPLKRKKRKKLNSQKPGRGTTAKTHERGSKMFPISTSHLAGFGSQGSQNWSGRVFPWFPRTPGSCPHPCFFRILWRHPKRKRIST